jgi:[1-hydroxy-2-(trimethylamino)ethyl]phosphonate dioxygenase
MTAPTTDTIVDVIADILTRRGSDSYLGEAVTMQQHMLQAAAQAEREGASDELVAAALLHDIGHYTGEFGEDYIEQGVDDFHEEAGAALLAPFFPPVVVACVRLHVAAKRYLCANESTYFGKLTPASVATLALQGGPMEPDEVLQFERNPFFREAVRARIWDEGAKESDAVTPPFDHFAPILRRVVERHAAA